jgi:hypothetical protein
MVVFRVYQCAQRKVIAVSKETETGAICPLG